jgi:hypothetical protein
MDIFMIIMLVILIGGLTFALIAKRRMDRNEPIFGWKRKQFLSEQGGADVTKKNGNSSSSKENSEQESLKDLISIKDIRYGVFEQGKNQYSIVLSSDFVNFDLLNPSERQSIILGYQALWRVVNFPVQLLGQAVRQDLAKDQVRFKENLKKCNPQTQDYNFKVINHIAERTINDFRIARRVYYVVSYFYETSKMGKLTPEQKERKIVEAIYQRANIVVRTLRRAKIDAQPLDSLGGMEVLKRALNRDRMIINPIETVVEPGKEKINTFITVDPTTLPGFEDLVQNYEEAVEIVKDDEEEIQEEDFVSRTSA